MWLWNYRWAKPVYEDDLIKASCFMSNKVVFVVLWWCCGCLIPAIANNVDSQLIVLESLLIFFYALAILLRAGKVIRCYMLCYLVINCVGRKVSLQWKCLTICRTHAFLCWNLTFALMPSQKSEEYRASIKLL